MSVMAAFGVAGSAFGAGAAGSVAVALMAVESGAEAGAVAGGAAVADAGVVAGGGVRSSAADAKHGNSPSNATHAMASLTSRFLGFSCRARIGLGPQVGPDCALMTSALMMSALIRKHGAVRLLCQTSYA